ncbi:Protein translation factor SUI1-like [Porphyridium purpureum]|uniref:Protein translation factor SUI1-like n=1 Tax=Porphyridium purpureum TaxID=35688 RepID=A0A5J4YKI8_PORPP|nr:Protein translation factor SUI1-like [Porphyridium purpureum]|eukprot:POR5199..scf244_11
MSLMNEEFVPAGHFDPFADAELADDNGVAPANANGGGAAGVTAKKSNLIHLRIQQRNGRKSLTTIQGLDKKLDLEKLMKAFKKEFCCNGNVVEDATLGRVIQLQGDQRENVRKFLVEEEIADKKMIKVHGI